MKRSPCPLKQNGTEIFHLCERFNLSEVSAPPFMKNISKRLWLSLRWRWLIDVAASQQLHPKAFCLSSLCFLCLIFFPSYVSCITKHYRSHKSAQAEPVVLTFWLQHRMRLASECLNTWYSGNTGFIKPRSDIKGEQCYVLPVSGKRSDKLWVSGTFCYCLKIGIL